MANRALLVVDMQNGFCHPEGARAKAFGVDSIAMPRASIPNVVEMMRMARSAGVRLTLTRQVHYPDDQARKRRRSRRRPRDTSREGPVPGKASRPA